MPSESLLATDTTVVSASAEGGTAFDGQSPTVALEMLAIEPLPHDPDAFTQGLVWSEGLLYESTGLYGESTIRIVEPETGRVIQSRDLDPEYFGEGLALVGDRLIQLTWKEEVALIWDVMTLEPLGTFEYEGEGWGLCAQPERLVMSDGSSWLTFRDPVTFQALGRVEVVWRGEPVERINELECVEDLVFANVWLTEEIVVIRPETGEVVGRVDAAPLVGMLSDPGGADVLNGIAYDPDTMSFILAGKLWSEIFRVRLFWEDHPTFLVE